MNRTLNLRRGLSLNLVGGIADSHISEVSAGSAAVTPDDFPGLKPKVVVKEGDRVTAGQPLMHDKTHTDIKLVSPVNGVVTAVVRGERRKVERVVVTPDAPLCTKASGSTPLIGADAGTLTAALKRSGIWAMMRQRPYDTIPDPDTTPRDIFISMYDLAPLAPDTDITMAGQQSLLEAGVAALAKLTTGNVYVCRRDGSIMTDIAGAVNYIVKGPYPASNAGIQAGNIAPVNKGECVWALNAEALLMVGRLVTGMLSYTATVALTGAGVTSPRYVRCAQGCAIGALLSGNINDTGRHLRYISGNVLTGVNVGHEGYLRWPYTQVTVIPEGDDVDEFMGWASLSPDKMSVSRTFPGRLFGKRRFNPDARLLGGRRAMIMSGEYDKVMPLDIMPEYLIKAIISRDIERMEALGIYEVAPEDFAAAEYVDTSKLPLQQIVRDGLEYMRAELG